MKNKLCITILGKLVLLVGILIVFASTGGGQIAKSASDDSPSRNQEPLEFSSSAAPPYTSYVYEQASVGPGVTGYVVATCPPGSTLVGGGFSANSSVTFYTQYPLGNAWRGDAKNNSTLFSREITVYAVCLHNFPGVSLLLAENSVTAGPGEVVKSVAACPAGSIVTGGGFFTYPDGSLRVYSSSKYSHSEGWESQAKNRSGAILTHKAYAICIAGSGGTTSQIMKLTESPPNSTASAFLQCNEGSHVTAGGFSAQEDLLIYSNSGPYSGNEWRVHVRNIHPSESRYFDGYAICLSLPEPPITDIYLPILVKTSAP